MPSAGESMPGAVDLSRLWSEVLRAHVRAEETGRHGNVWQVQEQVLERTQMHFYFGYHNRAECLVNTWLFWFKTGRWYVKLRLHGFEFGVGLGSN